MLVACNEMFRISFKSQEKVLRLAVKAGDISSKIDFTGKWRLLKLTLKPGEGPRVVILKAYESHMSHMRNFDCRQCLTKSLGCDIGFKAFMELGFGNCGKDVLGHLRS